GPALRANGGEGDDGLCGGGGWLAEEAGCHARLDRHGAFVVTAIARKAFEDGEEGRSKEDRRRAPVSLALLGPEPAERDHAGRFLRVVGVAFPAGHDGVPDPLPI